MNDSLLLRKKLELSQATLARLLEADRSLLAHYEAGRRPLNLMGEAYLTQALRILVQVPDPDPDDLPPGNAATAKAQDNIRQLEARRLKLMTKLDEASERYRTAQRKKAWVAAMRADALVQQRNIGPLLDKIEREAEALRVQDAAESIQLMKADLGSIDAQIAYWQGIADQAAETGRDPNP